MGDETPGQWISELFKPMHSFTQEDVMSYQGEGPIKSKIKRVPAFDPEAIQEVYEKVRVMKILEKEIKQQTREMEVAELAGRTTLDVEGPEEKVQNKTETLNNLNESSIWDSEELDVLRKVYKSAKGKITELEVELCEGNRRNEMLVKENIELRKELETNSSQLREARKANKRLKIHCDNLKQQLELSATKMDALTEMWKEMSEEKSAMQKETQELRIQTDRERLSRERLGLKVEEAEREIIREKTLAEESARVKYEKIVFDLEQEIAVLTEELQKERQSHDISKKALGSLRNHFASLPLQNIIPPNAVYTDQVGRVDHLNF